ncbi:MAG: aminopeptidase [Clostridiales bacterium]|nr:aminopeptidase [Clostridiales bacterium]
MRDARIDRLAETLVHFSTEVKPGENVLIQSVNGNRELVKALIGEVYRAGGRPYVWLFDTEVERALMMGCTEEQLNLRAEADAFMMRKMQVYIGVSAVMNRAEQADVPAGKQTLHSVKYLEPVHGLIRVPKTRWVVLRFPTRAMAQMANMSTEAFEDFYFDVCNMDYSRMDAAMTPLVEWMNRTDRVRIAGPGTDLTFSIKGIGAIKCSGRMNIPDGEVYTAPVRDSVNGVIRYNTPSTHDGFSFENVELTFRDGKIVEVRANDTKRANHIFDQDEGARYVGEFAIGVNPHITKAMNNILFDEKIMGSFHFTPGACYDECDNGNRSALHWDLVCIQTPEYGGGEMWFDDVLVRKDGRFVPKEIEGLNPENLI